jgi:large subunit ribosomal protein L16
MLMPKRTKFRKAHRGRRQGQSKGHTEVHFGQYGLKSLEAAWITNRQIESARVAMTRYIKRQGKVWINLFPHLPVTKKPAETRMGTGKGNVEYYVAVVKPGRILYEMEGMTAEVAHGALKLAQAKLPLLTKIVHRSEMAL